MTHVGTNYYEANVCLIDETMIVGNHVSMNTGCKIEENVRLEDRVTLGSWVTICKNVWIGAGTVVLDDTNVAEDVTIGKSVILGLGCAIGKGSVIHDGVVINAFENILPYSVIDLTTKARGLLLVRKNERTHDAQTT